MAPFQLTPTHAATAITTCGFCYMREAQHGNMMSIPCPDEEVEKLGKRIQKLFRQAAVHYWAATEAAYTSMDEKNAEASLREVRKADAALKRAWTIVQEAEELVLRMEKIPVRTGTLVAATAGLIQAFDRAADVVEIVRSGFAAVKARIRA